MANREDLDIAKKCLMFREIRLRSTTIEIDDDQNLDDLSFGDDQKIQSFKKVWRIIETESKQGIESACLYTFGYRVGIRSIEGSEDNESQDDVDDLVTIIASFDAIYASSSKLTKEQLEAFAENNVGYHVWPYWREYIQSTCQRIGVSPGLPVPVYILS